MTVVDSSVVVDVLLGDGVCDEGLELLANEAPLDGLDVTVFEVLSALRRAVLKGRLEPARAAAAVEDLGDIAVDLYPSLALRERAFELRENLTAADALFVALAEWLGEPLATKDSALAAAAKRHAGVDCLLLGGD